MSYVSAAFIFLFMPISVAVYHLIPVKHRKYALPVISCLYYVLANIRAPQATAVLILSLFLARILALKCGKKNANAAALILFMSLFFGLRAADNFLPFVVFPAGGSVFFLGCVSYVADTVKSREAGKENTGVSDMISYITFFPLIAAGPFVKYEEFRESLAGAKTTVSNVADGIKLFATGFVERIAVSAVLSECYGRVMEIGGWHPDALFELCAALFLFLSFVFAFLGVMDMGTGLARLYGIKIKREYSNALYSRSIREFFTRLFAPVADFFDEYAIRPALVALGAEKKKIAKPLSEALSVMFICLWIRTSAATLLVSFCMAVLTFILGLFDADAAFEKRKYLRPFGRTVMFLSVSVLLTAAVSDSFSVFLSAFNGFSPAAVSLQKYDFNMVMSGYKYVSTVVFAVLFRLFVDNADKIREKLPKKAFNAVEISGVAVLLLLFVFTVVCHMPVYPIYGIRTFRYLAF